MKSAEKAGWRRSARFRFYAELNDFLPPGRRKQEFVQHFDGASVGFGHRRRQLAEVVAALDLGARIRPFTRCIACNGMLETLPEADVRDCLPPGVRDR